jgi:hypothetical protein
MPDYDTIQLDAAFAYQQAALTATYRELRQTHGEAFAAHFMDECKDQVLQAAKTRLCGLCEAGVIDATRHLLGAPEAR